MNNNVRIARELVRIAKSLIAADDSIEQELKKLDTKCFEEFVKKFNASKGSTVTGDYIANGTINGKEVEVQMSTYSKNRKVEFKYNVKVGDKEFEQTTEAHKISVPYKCDSTYDFICNSDDDAKTFKKEYLDSITTNVGIAGIIDDAFKKAVAELEK